MGVVSVADTDICKYMRDPGFNSQYQQMDECIDGWLDGRMDGWTDKKVL